MCALAKTDRVPLYYVFSELLVKLYLNSMLVVPLILQLLYYGQNWDGNVDFFVFLYCYGMMSNASFFFNLLVKKCRINWYAYLGP